MRLLRAMTDKSGVTTMNDIPTPEQVADAIMDAKSFSIMPVRARIAAAIRAERTRILAAMPVVKLPEIPEGKHDGLWAAGQREYQIAVHVALKAANVRWEESS